ncbi:MAG TPA: OmpA family protein [Chitinophaga sp.]|uniref:OmpA family protein n=1 Tax=Chitinophaga sp. TaxID=1869181 RepID=UPI002C59AAD8|nr:OmpA family protein [Chitinophaga sp.]HVI46711.1 OmpA family protein [Chitinophaga sp.]
MRKYQLKYLSLFMGGVLLCGSCALINNHIKVGGNGITKVKRAERLYKRQEFEKAVSLCSEVINDGGNENAVRQAKFQLARIYFETRQFEKTVSLYDELLYKPAPDILVSDVTNYIDLLKRTGRVLKAKEISAIYAKSYKNNARFSNLQESLKDYYTFFNRDSLQNIRVDSLRLNLAGYQYGLALYKENIVFLSNDFKKTDAQSFYTNSKLYMISEDGVEPFNNSLRGVLQVGPASFFDKGQQVIYTSNRFTDVKNEKNSYINYNNGTQLLSSIYQPNHDMWSKPQPVRLGKSDESSSFLHPSVASNGKRLYFASDMPGGFGGTDIYYADWDKAEKRWKAPVNLGPSVNTNGNELYPFIIEDKLFFSSNGLRGFGGLDIFVINVRKPEEGAVHLPYPVNTQFDDLNPVLDEARLLLYFTSDRSGAHDNDHIYVLNLKKNPLKQLDLPYPGKPAKDDDKVPYTLNATDDRHQLTLTGDRSYDNQLAEKVAVKTVKAADSIPFTVSKAEVRAVREYSDAPVNSSPEMIPWQNSNSFTMQPLVTTTASSTTSATTATGPAAQYVTVTDSLSKAARTMLKMPGVIYYDLNSFVPQDQEWHKLDSIFYLWKAHPARMIVINGHTDIIGTERYNLALSRNRAEYIRECLLSRGVDAGKVQANYFGSTRPVLASGHGSLNTDREAFIQQQGVNRRCEIRIL